MSRRARRRIPFGPLWGRRGSGRRRSRAARYAPPVQDGRRPSKHPPPWAKRFSVRAGRSAAPSPVQHPGTSQSTSNTPDTGRTQSKTLACHFRSILAARHLASAPVYGTRWTASTRSSTVCLPTTFPCPRQALPKRFLDEFRMAWRCSSLMRVSKPARLKWAAPSVTWVDKCHLRRQLYLFVTSGYPQLRKVTSVASDAP
jgi:hypothetical protein